MKKQSVFVFLIGVILLLNLSALSKPLVIATYDKPLHEVKPNCWCVTSTYVGSVCCVYPDPNAHQGQVSVHLFESRPYEGYVHFMVRTWEYRYQPVGLNPSKSATWQWCWGWVNVTIWIPAGEVYSWAELYLEPGELIDEVNYTYDGPYRY